MTIPSTPRAADEALSGLRRTAVVFVIVSLSLAALLGIVTLFTGEFGEVQAKVMLTTLLVAGFSITALCHLAVVGRAPRLVGYIGVGVSGVALLLGLVLLWRSWENWSDVWEATLKAFVILAIVAVSLAQANLLLLLAGRRHRAVRIGLIVTLVCIALIVALVSPPIITDGDIPGEHGDIYWRLVGVVAILDALGTIVVPVLGRVFREGAAVLTVRLEGAAADAVQRLAHARGVAPAAVVADLVAEADSATTPSAPGDAASSAS